MLVKNFSNYKRGLSFWQRHYLFAGFCDVVGFFFVLAVFLSMLFLLDCVLKTGF
jgi:hypothetical protein